MTCVSARSHSVLTSEIAWYGNSRERTAGGREGGKGGLEGGEAEWEGSEGWEGTWLLWLSWWLTASFVSPGKDESQSRESGGS